MTLWRQCLVIISFGLLGGCTGSPEGVTPVSGFDIQRYRGTWHEIARLDHRFERGLQAVTATYDFNADGSLRVINRGFNPQTCRWKAATGRAMFVGDTQTGHLKVSFFGPFYGGYTVFALDQQNYAWAMVAGPSHGYLWILSRSPTLPPDTQSTLLMQARAAGFATDDLIFPAPEPPSCQP